MKGLPLENTRAGLIVLLDVFIYIPLLFGTSTAKPDLRTITHNQYLTTSFAWLPTPQTTRKVHKLRLCPKRTKISNWWLIYTDFRFYFARTNRTERMKKTMKNVFLQCIILFLLVWWPLRISEARTWLITTFFLTNIFVKHILVKKNSWINEISTFTGIFSIVLICFLFPKFQSFQFS